MGLLPFARMSWEVAFTPSGSILAAPKVALLYRSISGFPVGAERGGMDAWGERDPMVQVGRMLARGHPTQFGDVELGPCALGELFDDVGAQVGVAKLPA